ncbi:hypothetical protein DRW07_01070 [Alteromonas sediminis]|uniref:Glycosyltransferase family 1 protein n=1 Tax=Alteromonas sediminis TaxID=2259342 RepID=A0A3N5Y502_9ALTE|nr:hypothetical protein [Alteromonas sediminis]RPJ68036.1 hypothetical protein DRW07_01070 [Alteromonas sediminis]
MAKALLIFGSNQYGVVSHFFEGMATDLLASGVTVDLLDFSSPETVEATATNIDKLDNYDFIVSFNGVGQDIKLDNTRLSDYAKRRPLFIFLVDHPIHLMKRFVGIPATILCVDQEHVSFCQLCGFNARFFPHAVSAKTLDRKAIKDRTNKSGEILFPVSYFDLNNAFETLKPVWHQIAAITEQATTVTRFLQLLGVLPMGSRPASIALDENIRRIAVWVDHYLRAKSRTKILEACQQRGIKLTVVGKGSDKYAADFPMHHYEDASDYPMLVERIRNADFVLHNSPGFELGLHERVVAPLSVGTPVIADSEYIHGQFPKGILTMDNYASLTDEAYREHQISGFESVHSKHTWHQRWKDVLKEVG